MVTKLGVIVLVVGLIGAACGANQQSAEPTGNQPITTASPGSSQQTPASNPPATSEPTESFEPGATQPPLLPLEALPDPELGSAATIGEVMYDPSFSEQVVVSMLDGLGIGLYQTDGTPIRTGTETAATDLFLLEPEARALVDLLQDGDEEDAWISFRDFHAGLEGLGFQGSAEELAQAYVDSYTEQPDAAMTSFVYGLTPVGIDVPLPRFTALLLIIDGFVPPNGSTAAIASVGDGMVPAVAVGTRGWGVARSRIQLLQQVPLTVDPIMLVHLIATVGRSGLSVFANPSATHEGHGGPGAPVTITAAVRTSATNLTNPFNGAPLVPIHNGNVPGVAVTWTLGPGFDHHGTTSPPSGAITTTDALGETKVTFTPIQEAADGHGIVLHELGLVQVSASARDLITQVYGLPSLGALVPTNLSGVSSVDIAWHERETMRIDIANHYDVTIKAGIGDTHAVGDDTFTGNLVQQANGTWRGTVVGTAKGTQTGTTIFGGAYTDCTMRWNATEVLDVEGIPATVPGGKFIFRFTPLLPPTGNVGSSRCPPTRHKHLGILMAPFNDTRITDGSGLQVILPDRPGGERDYPVPPIPGSAFVIDPSTNWHVTIEFVTSP
jgi:hypothetical protein